MKHLHRAGSTEPGDVIFATDAPALWLVLDVRHSRDKLTGERAVKMWILPFDGSDVYLGEATSNKLWCDLGNFMLQKAGG